MFLFSKIYLPSIPYKLQSFYQILSKNEFEVLKLCAAMLYFDQKNYCDVRSINSPHMAY